METIYKIKYNGEHLGLYIVETKASVTRECLQFTSKNLLKLGELGDLETLLIENSEMTVGDFKDMFLAGDIPIKTPTSLPFTGKHIHQQYL